MAKITIRSRIKELLSVETLVQLRECTHSHGNNTQRGILVMKTLTDNGVKFTEGGSGTNRIGLMLGKYFIKIALDADGMTDNKREFKYSDKLYGYPCRSYEITQDGLVMICEQFRPLSQQEFIESESEIKSIIAKLGDKYLIGDIGFELKNSLNWGIRYETNEIGPLDFAQIYATNHDIMQCFDDRYYLEYNDNYSALVCPHCGREYQFNEIEKRISSEEENREIGDVMQMSYVVSEPSTILERNDSYTNRIYNEEEKNKEKKKEKKRKFKEARKRVLARENPTDEGYTFGPNDPRSSVEVIERMRIEMGLSHEEFEKIVGS